MIDMDFDNSIKERNEVKKYLGLQKWRRELYEIRRREADKYNKNNFKENDKKEH